LGSLPEVSSGETSNWSGVSHSNWGSNWDSDLGLNSLAVLLWDPLGHWGADDVLLDMAGGDWHSLGDLLGGVDTHLLGHLTAVRLDGDVRSGNSSWGSDHSWGGVGNANSSVGNAQAVATVAKAGSVPGISLGLPLDDADVAGLWATDLGGDLLALLLIGDRLLLDLLGVADLLRLWNTVLGLDSLVGDTALGSGHSFGHGLDNRAGHSHCWGRMSKADSSHAMAKAGTVAKATSVAEASAVPSLGLSSRGRSGISHGSGHARISNKLVHGDLV